MSAASRSGRIAAAAAGLGTLRRAAVVAAIIAVVLAPLAAPAGVAPAPVALGASTDLTVVTSAAYQVQPAKSLVHVVVNATLANHLADTKTNTYFFDHAFLAVQPGAASPRVLHGPAGARVSVTSRTANATMLRLDFGKLTSGKTATLQFAFDLKDTGTGTRRLVRVGTSLITFPVWAYASAGATGSRVSVQFPKGYDVQVESGSFASRTTGSDGGVVLATGALANPLTYFAYVSAQQPATYVASSRAVPVTGGSIALTLRAWKDDPSWSSRVGALFARALPLLRADIGLAWPHASPVVVQEAVSRSTGGYAGLYDPKADQIQVAYWASQAVIVHEAAHGWFNGSLVADRWAAEGFASLYAQRALAALKIKAAAPAITTQLKAVAFPLNAWPATPAPASAAENYGYAASYTLAALIAKRAGPDALARVWADAGTGIGAYQPSGGTAGSAPETTGGPPDWRGLLDLLEAETGSDFTDLWRTWVVRPDEAALLDARAAARTRYQAIGAELDGWALPRSVRDALRAWQFDTATQLIGQAEAVLQQRRAVEGLSAAAGVTLPDTMRRLFESGAFDAAAAEAADESAAISAIEAATAARSSSRDPLTAIGLIGADPDRDVATARDALASGDPAAAVASADAATQAWAAAVVEGRRRLLMGGSLLVAVMVIGASLAGRLRRSRRTVVAPAP